MNRHLRIAALVLAAAFLLPAMSEAQCVMCKAVAEDSASDGGLGRGLNAGILYLMAIPYLLLGLLAVVFFWRRNAKKAS